MARDRYRVCLQDGLKLDLARLARQRIVRYGSRTHGYGIQWTNSYTGELVAAGSISADLGDRNEGWFTIQLGSQSQTIRMIARPRHFGGRQWFFVCPVTGRDARVIWKPPGASRFCSRQTWGQQVAYRTQFMTATDRAHQGKARINSRLCSIGGLDSRDWDFPPKPKWMRWASYNHAEAKFDRYEAALDFGCAALVARYLGRINPQKKTV